MIYNEDKFFDTYKKEDLLQKKEIYKIVNFIVYKPLLYVQDIDSKEEEWVAIPPRLRLIEPALPTLPFVTTNTLKTTPVMPTSAPEKAPVPDPDSPPFTPWTPAETPSPHTTTLTGGPSVQIGNRRRVYLPDAPSTARPPDAQPTAPIELAHELPGTINTDSRRKGRKGKGKTPALPSDLPDTGDTALDVIKPNKYITADFSEDHILNTKRVR